ncbi:MAG: N-acetylmuramoyl-L-alanine amidase, partial [Muribaculaceae bacterium]|nr:N-acetylmuramoyl-L-alanine amidase [Muribaculaceae bacterium]
RAGQPFTRDDVDRWHRARGWQGIGYHYLVGLDGTVWPGRPESEQGAHCKGHNAASLGVCYVGGLDACGQPADTRTAAQRAALDTLLRSLRRRYPQARIRSHRDFAAKACPCFDATSEYARL